MIRDLVKHVVINDIEPRGRPCSDLDAFWPQKSVIGLGTDSVNFY